MKGFQWQVRNEHGHPASNEFGGLCIFPTRKKAREWRKYLREECGLNTEKFHIRKVTVQSVKAYISNGKEKI